MNVVDYFNEKWNEFKSDGQKGEMKEFEYKKEKFNKFKQKVIGKETKYLAYRRTKEQKLRSIRNNQQFMFIRASSLLKTNEVV